jgi:surface protein
MEGMFEGCSSLPAIDLKNFDTKNVKNMNKMFYRCPKLEIIDISNFDEIDSKFAHSGIFDNNHPKKGKMKVNEKFYDCVKKNIPSRWKIEFDNNNSNNKKKK